jgi:nucleoside-diphosphate-sugar epimerase
LAEQAVAAGVRRFVFLSTVKVLGEESPARPFCDSDRPAPCDAYAISKYEAEQGLFELAARTGLDVVVLRPPLVYGPGVKANFLALMNWLAKGRPLPLGALKNRRSFCYLGNLCDAILAALEHPAAVNRAFLVGDAETLALKDFVGRLALALGHPAHLWPVPAAWLEAGGALLGKGDSVRRLTRSLEIEVSGIRAALGWQPPCAIEAGLIQTAQAYRARQRHT